MPKPIPTRIDAIVVVLERLASDVEVIREGLEAINASLSQKRNAQRRLLREQVSALERISIGLGMVQHTAASLGEIRDHALVILEVTQTLASIKNGLDMVLVTHGHPEEWHSMMLERAAYRFDQCVARIREAAVCLSEKKTGYSNTEQ